MNLSCLVLSLEFKIFPTAVNWSISSHDHYPQGVAFSIHRFTDAAGNLWFCSGCPDDTYFLKSFTCIVIPSFSHDFCWLPYLQTLATTIISCVLLLKSPSSLALHKNDLLKGFFSFSLFLFYWYFVTLRSGTDLKDLLFVQKAPPRFFPKRFDTCCNPYHEAMLVLSKLLTSSVKGKLFLFGLSTMLSVLLWFIPHWNIFLQQFCSSYSL